MLALTEVCRCNQKLLSLINTHLLRYLCRLLLSLLGSWRTRRPLQLLSERAVSGRPRQRAAVTDGSWTGGPASHRTMGIRIEMR